MTPAPTIAGESAQPGFRGSYVRQRPSDLALSIYAGYEPADREWVLAERDVHLGEWRLRVQIVGASHVVAVGHGRSAFTETLVARPVHACPARRLDSLPAGSGGALSVDLEDCSYTVALLRLPVLPEAMPLWEKRLLSEAPNRLSCAYPAPPGVSPGITAVAWELRGEELHLKSTHTYPEGSAVVTTVGICSVAGRTRWGQMKERTGRSDRADLLHPHSAPDANPHEAAGVGTGNRPPSVASRADLLHPHLASDANPHKAAGVETSHGT